MNSRAVARRTLKFFIINCPPNRSPFTELAGWKTGSPRWCCPAIGNRNPRSLSTSRLLQLHCQDSITGSSPGFYRSDRSLGMTWSGFDCAKDCANEKADKEQRKKGVSDLTRPDPPYLFTDKMQTLPDAPFASHHQQTDSSSGPSQKKKIKKRQHNCVQILPNGNFTRAVTQSLPPVFFEWKLPVTVGRFLSR